MATQQLRVTTGFMPAAYAVLPRVAMASGAEMDEAKAGGAKANAAKIDRRAVVAVSPLPTCPGIAFGRSNWRAEPGTGKALRM